MDFGIDPVKKEALVESGRRCTQNISLGMITLQTRHIIARETDGRNRTGSAWANHGYYGIPSSKPIPCTQVKQKIQTEKKDL
ncbi:hypothetical protein TcarDRAFT_0336 [Thermosinus carboxydivorans Nor1]|uniref:Uncharacterized protein n=1 Tax=Thermosinus carboxydivorans Nor1 TaxID=401526 RepID=A1HTL7_9FIRM|nr:hypothetical protein [Thermosinus carboxydivorans]EAX46642.1 hypothetical protein TcarDRAFT_0336 [Thermosinus carboxydivorans Nor1]